MTRFVGFACLSFLLLCLLQVTSTSVYRNLAEYDGHGCCTSCGEFYCKSSSKCETDWENCELGTFDSSKCTYNYNAASSGFSYDLSPYTKSNNGFYTISDIVTHKHQTFKYYFNLCSPIKKSLLPGVCNDTYGTAAEVCETDSFAYQHFSTTWNYESCYRCSGCFETNKPQVELGLLNPVDPASGVFIKYSGGNTCPNSYSEKDQCSVIMNEWGYNMTYCARSFKLNINCHDEIDQIPEHEEVLEAAGCAYEATINHRMGCPVECPRDPLSGRVCSSRGDCFFAGFDGGTTVDDDNSANNRGLQCTCEYGYYGSYCQYAGFGGYASTLSKQMGTPLWVVGLLFLMLCASTGGLIYQNWTWIVVFTSGVWNLMHIYFVEMCLGGDGRGVYSRVPTKTQFEGNGFVGDIQIKRPPPAPASSATSSSGLSNSSSTSSSSYNSLPSAPSSTLKKTPSSSFPTPTSTQNNKKSLLDDDGKNDYDL